MLIQSSNNVKIYNLSAGKSLPEWLSDRKKRALQSKDLDIRRRVELIQDFDMPGVSTSIKVSKDGRYIMATGIYKPRVRCYEVANLSMKFERCMDSEVIKFEMLSEDYSKVVFLQCDRFVEFHAQYGRYYRTRIPKFGRDLKYHYQSCNLYIVGTGPDVYRLNLEEGRFLNSFQTEATTLNVCDMNPFHQLFVCGSKEGKVEAWDPRARNRVGVLDCALHAVTPDTQVLGIPQVTAVKFRDALTMGVGTSTGQILLYDLRSNRPTRVKDHRYGLPIKTVDFHHLNHDLVASMDSRIVRLWDRNTGEPYVSVEATSDLNDLCLVPNSGMMFMATEDKKMLTYYIPNLGPAPRWCSFLDSLTEELEEGETAAVYDDYKFLTVEELHDLGFSHLIGTNLLRAYMHGYFIDMRLYRKAKSIIEPLSLTRYKQNKVKETIDQQRSSRVQLQKLPAVNRELALKLMEDTKAVDDAEAVGKKSAAKLLMKSNILNDSRFKDLFVNPNFQIDKSSEEFRLLNPAVSRLDKIREKRIKKALVEDQFEPVEGASVQNPLLDDEFSDSERKGRKRTISQSDASSSSSDDESLRNEIKLQHKIIRDEKFQKRRLEREQEKLEGPKFMALKPGQKFQGFRSANDQPKKKLARASLGERIHLEEDVNKIKLAPSAGSREMTFTLPQSERVTKAREQAQHHHEERRKIIRSANHLRTRGRGRGGRGRF
ncbi:nucleolar protein 10-like isoform X1 [Daphnia carinata]|uniref:nucleolar protein 10-like isoform X1 n=1 Tax=Daphnia carinata TaxID=120202 RepID=UPI00257EE052|nr:nucleolar protein 10-like isoform X1 [Daphnia carinata]